MKSNRSVRIVRTAGQNEAVTGIRREQGKPEENQMETSHRNRQSPFQKPQPIKMQHCGVQL